MVSVPCPTNRYFAPMSPGYSICERYTAWDSLTLLNECVADSCSSSAMVRVRRIRDRHRDRKKTVAIHTVGRMNN